MLEMETRPGANIPRAHANAHIYAHVEFEFANSRVPHTGVGGRHTRPIPKKGNLHRCDNWRYVMCSFIIYQLVC